MFFFSSPQWVATELSYKEIYRRWMDSWLGDCLPNNYFSYNVPFKHFFIEISKLRQMGGIFLKH
jgi:hypothetical protein